MSFPDKKNLLGKLSLFPDLTCRSDLTSEIPEVFQNEKRQTPVVAWREGVPHDRHPIYQYFLHVYPRRRWSCIGSMLRGLLIGRDLS